MAHETLVVYVPEFKYEFPTVRDVEAASQEIVSEHKRKKSKWGKATFEPDGWMPYWGNEVFIRSALTHEDEMEFWGEARARGLVDGFAFFRYTRLQNLFDEMYPEFEGVFRVTEEGIIVDPALPEMNVVELEFFDIPEDAEASALVLPKKIIVPKKNEFQLNIADALNAAGITDGYLVSTDMLY
jgi:hypothetical protein